jgi:hypothetical protein
LLPDGGEFFVVEHRVLSATSPTPVRFHCVSFQQRTTSGSPRSNSSIGSGSEHFSHSASVIALY